MPAITSPTRRVLGEKTPNASIQIRSPSGKAKDTAQSWDAQSLSSPKKKLFSIETSLSKSPKIGQKRRREEIDDVPSNITDAPYAQSLSSKGSDVVDDNGTEQHDGIMVVSSREKIQMELANPLSLSQDSDGIEVQFEIQEEMSQPSLDNMHSISLPPNGSQMDQALRPTFEKEPSQVSVSMFSLIDFDHNASSQEETSSHTNEPEVQPDQSKRQRTEEDRRKDLMVEKAEALRTRLRLALYKVQTNQASKPFSRLQLPKPRSSSPDLPPPPRSSSSHSSATQRPNMNSPESRVALARARATTQAKPTIKPLESIPFPKIQPTAFSARWIEEDQEQATVPIPSSPPLSRGPEVHIENVDDSPPQQRPMAENLIATPRTPMQLGSPPGSRERDVHMRTISPRKPLGLTSSVVKGEAASGLLELLRGRENIGET